MHHYQYGDEEGEMGDDLPYVELGSGTSLRVPRPASVVASPRAAVATVAADTAAVPTRQGAASSSAIASTLATSAVAPALASSLTPPSPPPSPPTPYDLQSCLGGVMSASPIHTCAVLATSELKCWGYSRFGVLGLGDGTSNIVDGSGEMGDNLPVVDLGFGMRVKAVVTGKWHTCALLDVGAVKCWGISAEGRLGEDGAWEPQVLR